MTYTIEYSNGRTDKGYESIGDAVKQLRLEYDHLEGFEITLDEEGESTATARDANNTWLAFVFTAY